MRTDTTSLSALLALLSLLLHLATCPHVTISVCADESVANDATVLRVVQSIPPASFAFDGYGNVYTPSAQIPTGNIAQYDIAGNRMAILNESASFLAFDSRGYAYVVPLDATNATVAVRAPNGTFVRILEMPAGSSQGMTMRAITVDNADSVWLGFYGYNSLSVIKYDADWTLVANESPKDLPSINSLAVDSIGRLYVSGASYPDFLFANSTIYRFLTNNQPDNEFNALNLSAQTIAIDSNDMLYAAQGSSATNLTSIDVYTTSGKYVRTIQLALPFSTFAIDRDDNFFVSYINSSAPSGFSVEKLSPTFEPLHSLARTDDMKFVEFTGVASLLAVDSFDRVVRLYPTYLNSNDYVNWPICVGDVLGRQLMPCSYLTGLPLPDNYNPVFATDSVDHLYALVDDSDEESTGLYVFDFQGTLLSFYPLPLDSGQDSGQVALANRAVTMLYWTSEEDGDGQVFFVAIPPNGTYPQGLVDNLDLASVALAISHDDAVLYVVDYNMVGARLLRVDAYNGTVLSTTYVDNVRDPVSLAVDPVGNVYIADDWYLYRRVVRVDASLLPNGPNVTFVNGTVVPLNVPASAGSDLVNPAAIALSSNGSLLYVRDNARWTDVLGGLNTNDRLFVVDVEGLRSRDREESFCQDAAAVDGVVVASY